MAVSSSGGTCRICVMNPKYTHSANEHLIAEELVGPLVEYVKTDAFTSEDRRLTYGQAIDRFQIPTTVRRCGRVLDAVDRILVSTGWPPVAAAGIAAYVVAASSGEPGDGWVEVWNMNPRDARAEARSYIRQLTLGPEED